MLAKRDLVSYSLRAQTFPVCGFHVEPGALDPESVSKLHAFLERRRQVLSAQFESWADSELETAEDYCAHQLRIAEYESRGLPKELRHFLTGEFDLATRMHPCVREVLQSDRLREFICEFLDTDQFFFHYPPMMRFKIAGAKQSIVPIHQDGAYNRHLSDFVTMWIPAVNIENATGGVIVYEGSHVEPMAEHRAAGPWANRAIVSPLRYPARHVTMRAGDALAFPPTLLHESAPHEAAEIRYNIDLRVFPRGASSEKPFLDPRTGTVHFQRGE